MTNPDVVFYFNRASFNTLNLHWNRDLIKPMVSITNRYGLSDHYVTPDCNAFITTKDTELTTECPPSKSDFPATLKNAKCPNSVIAFKANQ